MTHAVDSVQNPHRNLLPIVQVYLNSGLVIKTDGYTRSYTEGPEGAEQEATYLM
jgi:hypothetical protein